MSETLLVRVDKLIREGVYLIPEYTPRRGFFNSSPELGYDARHPGVWQREFLEVLDSQLLEKLRPDTGDIVALIHFENFCTLSWASGPTYQRLDGSIALIPTATISTTLGYALLEMIVRKLLGNWQKDPSFTELLPLMEKRRPIPDLATDLASLNDRMRYEEMGGERNLYWRLMQGRRLLLHGNLLRSTEFEGALLVLLIDLVVLHIMRDALQARLNIPG